MKRSSRQPLSVFRRSRQSSIRVADDISSELDSVLDIMFPVFAAKDYKLDIEYALQVSKWVLNLPPVEVPLISDAFFFTN
jgi:hypothetical protein